MIKKEINFQGSELRRWNTIQDIELEAVGGELWGNSTAKLVQP